MSPQATERGAGLSAVRLTEGLSFIPSVKAYGFATSPCVQGEAYICDYQALSKLHQPVSFSSPSGGVEKTTGTSWYVPLR